MKIFLKLMVICLLVVSCEETQSELYDGAQTLISFNSVTSVLAVTIDDTGTVDIPVVASTLSSQDRTFNVTLNTDPLKTTTDLRNFSLPATVTIPANEYLGLLTVTGIDFDLETSTELITIGLEGSSGTTVVSNVEHTIKIKQVCPVSAPFAGEYAITQLTAINPDDGVPVFSDQIVTVTAVDATARKFSAVYLEGAGIGQPASTIPFTLLCNEVVVGAGIGTGLSCGGTPPITLGPASIPSTYDAEDDSVFELTLTEYVTDGGCGANPYQVTFRFTKQ